MSKSCLGFLSWILLHLISSYKLHVYRNKREGSRPILLKKVLRSLNQSLAYPILNSTFRIGILCIVSLIHTDVKVRFVTLIWHELIL